MRIILVTCICLTLVSAAYAGNHLSTQREINELAARFIDTQEVLSGLTGSARPGEVEAHYQMRIRGYLRALDQSVRESADLRATTRSGAAWKHIAEDAARLKDEVSRCHTVWERQQGANSGRTLGQTLAKALQSVLSILNGLRDARP